MAGLEIAGWRSYEVMSGVGAYLLSTGTLVAEWRGYGVVWDGFTQYVDAAYGSEVTEWRDNT